MFVEIRVTSKINEINGASESEEEINGDLARRAKLKKQLLRSRTIEEVQKNLKMNSKCYQCLIHQKFPRLSLKLHLNIGTAVVQKIRQLP